MDLYNVMDDSVSELLMPQLDLSATDTFAASTDTSLPDASTDYTLPDASICTEDLTLTDASVTEDIRCRDEKHNAISPVAFTQFKRHSGRLNLTGTVPSARKGNSDVKSPAKGRQSVAKTAKSKVSGQADPR